MSPSGGDFGETAFLKWEGQELSLGMFEREDTNWRPNHAAGPYIFISHTGRDDVKEKLARPTNWFLQMLGKRTFFDDGGLQGGSKWGDPKVAAVAKPCFECTHALVILSPRFREQKYCVMELNTFMYRLQDEESFRFLPALWLLQDAKDYHSKVDNRVRIRNNTENPVEFMLHTLWPRILHELGEPMMPFDELESHFRNYVEDSTQCGASGLPEAFKVYQTTDPSQNRGTDSDCTPTDAPCVDEHGS